MNATQKIWKERAEAAREAFAQTLQDAGWTLEAFTHAREGDTVICRAFCEEGTAEVHVERGEADASIVLRMKDGRQFGRTSLMLGEYDKDRAKEVFADAFRAWAKHRAADVLGVEPPRTHLTDGRVF